MSIKLFRERSLGGASAVDRAQALCCAHFGNNTTDYLITLYRVALMQTSREQARLAGLQKTHSFQVRVTAISPYTFSQPTVTNFFDFKGMLTSVLLFVSFMLHFRTIFTFLSGFILSLFSLASVFEALMLRKMKNNPSK